MSPKGEQYLSAARPDYQPPLVLPLTGEMVDGKEHENTSNRVGDLKSVTTLEKEGFSEVGNFIFFYFFYCCRYSFDFIVLLLY